MKANTFAAQASVADLENVRLSAQADLAADYYELRAQDALKQLLDSTVSAYQEDLDLTRDLYTSGLGADEAVAEAEAQLIATKRRTPTSAFSALNMNMRSRLLAGQPASTFSLPPSEAFRPTPPSIPVGLPSELLERRPDIAAAERSVAQANAQIGIAKTAFFPAAHVERIAASERSRLQNGSHGQPGLVRRSGLAQTIFDAGLRRATVQQYQAAYDQTVANYRQTVLTAFQQVEDNLAALRILAQVIEQQDSAIESAGRSLQEAEVRYQAGLDPYLNVITAQTALLNDQQAAVNFREQQMVASVQLIKALGGGWFSAKP